MGLLKMFSKPVPTLTRLPSGSFTVDRTGRQVAGTVPSDFPTAAVQAIGEAILQTFREAQTAQLPLSEVTVNYGSFKIVAREMRGGALIFLKPVNAIASTK
jgi:hypothetical protein